MGTPADTNNMTKTGGEVLVLEKDSTLAETLAELLTSTGLVVTATSDDMAANNTNSFAINFFILLILYGS